MGYLVQPGPQHLGRASLGADLFQEDLENVGCQVLSSRAVSEVGVQVKVQWGSKRQKSRLMQPHPADVPSGAGQSHRVDYDRGYAASMVFIPSDV